jgi:hypothetical protein
MATGYRLPTRLLKRGDNVGDDVFFTTYVVPDDTTQVQLKELLAFLANSRSIAAYSFNTPTGALRIIVANRWQSLKYSDCPLPGTHDFAAGWLAHEAMLTVSKYLNAGLIWKEAEYHRENGRLDARKIRNRDKPDVIIDWKAFVEE